MAASPEEPKLPKEERARLQRQILQKNLLWFLVMLTGLLIITFMSRGRSTTTVREVTISELATAVENGQVTKVTVENDTKVSAELKDNSATLTATMRGRDQLADYGITKEKSAINIVYKTGWDTFLNVFITIISPLIFLAAIFFIFRATAGANMRAMTFGKTKARSAENTTVRFSDVAGLSEAKQELEEEVEFLKNPQKFTELGAEIPKGVLLVGPPGTGKTLLAKAVAGEAGVPFFSLSASEFVEMFVGVGASRVRDLFEKAAEQSPCIIFIDELDAIGRQRGTGVGGGHDEREQTLNEILVQMDGFAGDKGVIVMAATNRPDVLDPALLRPGRFDRRVVVDLPTRKERVEVLALYAKNKPIADDVSIDEIAGRTPGLAPADLKNILNEAAILTARQSGKKITRLIVNKAVERVLVGPERKSRILSEAERRVTAIHEAGHAIVGHVLEHTDPVHKVSIISHGNALGLTWTMPREDQHLVSTGKFHDELAMLLGGRLAEQLVIGDITTGASNDLQRVTSIAKRMVTEYGMSKKLGLRTYGEHHEQVFLGRSISEQRDYSEAIAEEIDREVSIIVKNAEEACLETLKKYRPALDALTDHLLAEETIEGTELRELLSSTTGIVKEHPGDNVPTS
jgi:cell division protease FtsH